MSINRNFGRTLSGATDIEIDNLNLPSRINSIRVGGFSGNVGDVLGKDVNNKLVFQTLSPFVIDPDSIDGTKLRSDITFSTTRSITANGLTSTGNMLCEQDLTVDGQFNFNGDLDINDLTVDSLTIDAGAVGVAGIELNQHTITGSFANLQISGNTGAIICNDLTTKNNLLVEAGLEVVGNIESTGNLVLDTGNVEITLGGLTAPAGIIECLELETSSDITCGGDIDLTGNLSTTNGQISTANGLISGNTFQVDTSLNCNGTIYTDNIQLPATGAGLATVSTINGTTGDYGTIGDFNTTAGDIKSGSGDIFTTSGTIHADSSYIRGNDLRFLNSIQFGNTLPSIFTINNNGDIDTAGQISTDYAGSFLSEDYALNLSSATSHGFIGGSLKVNGTIYGNFEGTITEETIDAQKLNIRVASPPVAGITGIDINNGLLRVYNGAGSGVFEVNANGAISNVQEISMYGGSFNNINSGLFVMNNTIMRNILSAGGASNKLQIDFGNAEITFRESNVNRVIVNSDIRLYDETQTQSILLDSSLGDIIITGTLYGNVVGTITEETIDAQKINIRSASPPVAGITGIDINNGSLRVYDSGDAGVFEITPLGTINNVQNIIMRGTTFNNVNSANFIMGTGNSILSNTTAGSTSNELEISFGDGSTNNSEILLRNSNSEKIKLDGSNGDIDLAGDILGTGSIVGGYHTNNLSNFTLLGNKITHTLNGTSLRSVILRSPLVGGISYVREYIVPSVAGGSSGSATGLGEIGNFNILSAVAVGESAVLTIDTYFSRTKGNPDFYVRYDSASGSTNSKYPSQSNATLIKNSADSEQGRHKFSIMITGLTIGTTYSFYPKFCSTTLAGSHIMKLLYGTSYGDTFLTCEFRDDYLVYDPLAPADDY